VDQFLGGRSGGASPQPVRHGKEGREPRPVGLIGRESAEGARIDKESGDVPEAPGIEVLLDDMAVIEVETMVEVVGVGEGHSACERQRQKIEPGIFLHSLFFSLLTGREPASRPAGCLRRPEQPPRDPLPGAYGSFPRVREFLLAADVPFSPSFHAFVSDGGPIACSSPRAGQQAQDAGSTPSPERS
jgi:hypothetical protein